MLALFDAAQKYLDFTALHRAGYFAGSRYLAPLTAEFDWKRCEAAEAKALRDAGLVLQLNWETSGGMMIGTPASVGHDHAVDAMHQAERIGGYGGSLVYFSDDTNTGSLDQVAPYMEGVANAVGPQGFYGPEPTGLQLMDRGLAAGLWVANASSWSGFGNDWSAMRRTVDPRAGLIQHTDHPLGFVGAIDHNEILRQDWLGAAHVPGSDDVGYSQWAPLEKIAFANDVRSVVIAVLRGDPAIGQTVTDFPEAKMLLDLVRSNEGANVGHATLLTDIHETCRFLIDWTKAHPGATPDDAVVRKALADVLHTVTS